MTKADKKAEESSSNVPRGIGSFNLRAATGSHGSELASLLRLRLQFRARFGIGEVTVNMDDPPPSDYSRIELRTVDISNVARLLATHPYGGGG